MEYHSFYGGRRGAPFIIRKIFPDIPSMVREFQKGYAYTEVNFELYVMIQNPYRLHTDNGKIFKRGYNFDTEETIDCLCAFESEDNVLLASELVYNQSDDFYLDKENVYHRVFCETTEDRFPADPDDSSKKLKILTGGAEYIGQVQGPPGPAPITEVESIASILDRQRNKSFSLNMENASLVDGKDYNDIKIYWANLPNESYSEDKLYLAFKIPYLHSDFEAIQGSPYDEPKALIKKPTSEESLDKYNRPFYKLWQITIPQGYHGDDLRNYRITTLNEENKISNIVYIWDNGVVKKISTSGEELEIYSPDFSIYDSIIVYDEYIYDTPQASDKPDGVFQRTFYMGLYKQLLNITTENGKLKFNFTAGNPVFLNTFINTSDSEVNPIEGKGSQKVKIGFTNDQDITTLKLIGAPLNYLMELQLTSDRHLIALYSDPLRRLQLHNNRFSLDTSLPKAYMSGSSDEVYRKFKDSLSPNISQLQPYTGWHDLGVLGTDSGILIGGRVTSTELELLDVSDIEKVIRKLNSKYPQGYYKDPSISSETTNSDLYRFKVITVAQDTSTPAEEGLANQNFYAYSFSSGNGTRGWYYLGSLADSVSDSVLLRSTNASDLTEKQKNLSQLGLWFVVKKLYSITYNLTGVTCNNTISTIFEDLEYITQFSGSVVNFDTDQSTMGETSLSEYYDSVTKTLNIPHVTGDITIVASVPGLIINNQLGEENNG